MQCPECGSSNIRPLRSIPSILICEACAKTGNRDTFDPIVQARRQSRKVVFRLLRIALLALVVFFIVWIAVSTLFPGILPIGFEIDDSGAWICTYLPTSTGDCYPIWDRTGA